MITRLLPPAEWSKLAGTELEPVWPLLDPGQAHIVVVEEDAQIIGCWAVYPLIHVEGVWIAPTHRQRGSVARRLLLGMRATARAMGAKAVNTAAISAEVETMLRTLGAVQLPGTHWALGLARE